MLNRESREYFKGEGLRISVQNDDTAPKPQDVRTQLERVLSSADFGASPQLVRFLRFVVDETLAGRGGTLKAYTIGVQVFNRPESFDPQSDSIVRVEGSRLRRKLNQYYLGVGRQDPVRIELPKGSYVPLFAHASTDGDGAADRTLPEAGQSPRPHRIRLRYGLIALAAIILGSGLFIAGRFVGERPPAPVTETLGPVDISVSLPKGPSIAVLPFKNLSGDHRQDYFGVGLAEQIIANLTRFRNLFVIASDTTVRYAEEPGEPSDIGARLGVDYVLEGSVQRLPTELRVTAALIKVGSGHVVWSDDFDRKLSFGNALEVQDDITEKIVVAIAPSYGAIYRDTLNYLKRHETENFFAYDCVLQAMAYRERSSSKSLPEIIDCLEESVAADPHYAKAWAFLSIIYLHEYLVGYSPEMYEFDTDQRGYEAALRAITEDPQSAVGYSALSSAYFFRQDLDLFRWYGARAIDLNPNDVDILATFGSKIAISGDWDLGTQMIRKAATLNPAHGDWYYLPIAFADYSQGKFQRASAELSKIRPTNRLIFYLLSAIINRSLGDMSTARKATDELETFNPHFARNAKEIMRRWNLPDPLIERIVEDLREIGLEIPN